MVDVLRKKAYNDTMSHELVNFLPHSMAVMDNQSYKIMIGVHESADIDTHSNGFMSNMVKAQQCVYFLKNFTFLSIIRNLTPYDSPDLCEILIFCGDNKIIELVDFDKYCQEELTQGSNKNKFLNNFSNEEKKEIIEEVYRQYQYINNGEADPFKINIKSLTSLVSVFKDDNIYKTNNSNIFQPYFNSIEANEITNFSTLNNILPKALDKNQDKAFYFLNYAIQEKYEHIALMIQEPRFKTAFNNNKSDILDSLLYLANIDTLELLIKAEAVTDTDIKERLTTLMTTTAMLNYKAQIESCWLKFNLDAKQNKTNKKTKLGI